MPGFWYDSSLDPEYFEQLRDQIRQAVLEALAIAVAAHACTILRSHLGGCMDGVQRKAMHRVAGETAKKYRILSITATNVNMEKYRANLARRSGRSLRTS